MRPWLLVASVAGLGCGGGGVGSGEPARLGADISSAEAACPELGHDLRGLALKGDDAAGKRVRAYFEAGVALEQAVVTAEQSLVEACHELQGGLGLAEKRTAASGDGSAATKACAQVLPALEVVAKGLGVRAIEGACRVDQPEASGCYARCGAPVMPSELGSGCGAGPCPDLGPRSGPLACRVACGVQASLAPRCAPIVVVTNAAAGDEPTKALLSAALPRVFALSGPRRQYLERALAFYVQSIPHLELEFAEAGGKAIACFETAGRGARRADVSLESIVRVANRVRAAALGTGW